MNKTIRLGDTNYELTSSVFSVIKYKSLFGSDVFKDITKFGKDLEDFSTSIEVATKCLYVLNLPNMQNKISYEEFLNTLPIDLFLNEENINQLVDVFSMFVSTNNNKQTPILKQ